MLALKSVVIHSHLEIRLAKHGVNDVIDGYLAST